MSKWEEELSDVLRSFGEQRSINLIELIGFVELWKIRISNMWEEQSAKNISGAEERNV